MTTRIRPALAVSTSLLSLSLALAPLILIGRGLGWFPPGVSADMIQIDGSSFGSPHSMIGALLYAVVGIVILTAVLHAARWIARGHARLAKALLVEPGA